MVDFLDPTAEFSAAEYAALAAPLVEEDLHGHGSALIVGGTGLYMRAALAPLAVAPSADPALRAELEKRARVEGAAVLHADLARRDPAAAAAVDPRNVRRVMRALETVMSTGSSWSGREDLWRPRYRHPTFLAALRLEREELYRGIETRARTIVEGGAVEEVRRFLALYPEVAARARSSRSGIAAAIGFSEICRYLEGAQSLDATVEQVAAATRKYARRQLTWLRKVDGLVIIDVQGRKPGDVADEILGLVRSGEHTKEPQYP